MSKKYQLDYAAGRPEMYDKKSRILRADRAVKVLEDHFGKGKLKSMSALNIGSSTGIIDNALAAKVGKMTGVDIDEKAVKHAKKSFKRKNLKFEIGDGMKLKFKKNTFDIVFCMQIYEHVPDDTILFKEIFRVLKPGGVCYFAAGNRFWPLEYHYNLLFLSWFPKKISNIYLRLLGRGDSYYENLRSYRSLEALTKKFKRVDYTQKILKSPKKYKYEDKLPSGKIRTRFASMFSPIIRYFAPTFFWILEKK